MAGYQCPEDWKQWSQWLSAGLHARNRWRLPVLLLGILFAMGRRTVSVWLRALESDEPFFDSSTATATRSRTPARRSASHTGRPPGSGTTPLPASAISLGSKLTVRDEAVDQKLRGVETPVCQALVRDSFQEASRVLQKLKAEDQAWVRDFRTKILDGYR